MIIKKYDVFCESLIDHGDKVYWGKIAAGVLPICITTKKILVNLRSEAVMEGLTYGVWGGKLDDDETDTLVAAKREFIEETEYNGDVELIAAYVYKNPTESFEYHNYIGLIDKEFIPKLDWESAGYKWLTYEELIDLDDKHFGLIELLKYSKDLIEKYI